MLQAILSRVHYNLTHPNTPMAIKPLVEEQFREQQRKQTQWQAHGRTILEDFAKRVSDWKQRPTS